MSCEHEHEHEDLSEAIGTDDVAEKLSGLRHRFLNSWLDALDDFNSTSEAVAAGIDPATKVAVSKVAAKRIQGEALTRLVERWHGLLDGAYRGAYADGQSVWGRGGRTNKGLSPAAEAVLKREKEFAFRFAVDVARGPRPGERTFPVGTRSAMYGLAIEGGYNRGAVDASPPGQLIWWRLGDARHCVDCPILAANSPYTAETLPTTPRAGSTTCWTNCKCHLEFGAARGTRAARPAPPSPDETLDDKERERDLRGRVEGPLPKPPPGKRLPDERENRQIQDLRHRMAFASRRADRAQLAGDDAERDKWLGVRKDINGQLIDFQRGRKIWAPPTFSDKEILTSADLKAGDVDWLTHLRGIDGKTVHRAQASAIEQAMNTARGDLGKFLGDLPPGGGPAVPDFDELLRRAGAPRSSFTGEFGDALDWHDDRALLEAAQIQDPATEVVYSIVGLGLADTLRLVPAAFEACRAREYDLAFGPCAEGWEDVIPVSGFWVQGVSGDVRLFIAALSRLLGGRGLEVALWQP